MDMKKTLSAVPVGLALFLSAAIAVPAQAADDSAEAIQKGKFGFAYRYRLENVYQDDFDYDAVASTLRLRLNYKSRDWSGFSFFVEGDYVAELGWNDFNAGGGNTPDRTQYPVVADPDGEDLNQAFMQLKNDSGTMLRAGRQRIIYDNSRFVGNVGWRQNEQTFDGAYLQQKVGKFDLQGAYITQVNRIFGNDVPAGRHDNSTWLLNGSKAWDGLGKLTAYYYDINNKDAAKSSTRSYGARFAGAKKIQEVNFGYNLELARQKDAHNNPVDYSANYYRLDVSFGISKITPYLGYEVLGGDANRDDAAFRTPLATLHAFNGWADKFLTTPKAGLEDFFIGAKGKAGKFNWNVLWHDFSAEDSSAKYGSEVDASIGSNFSKSFGVLFKVAWFNADTSSTYYDTTKLWIQLTGAF